jgi:hypothetical protein
LPRESMTARLRYPPGQSRAAPSLGDWTLDLDVDPEGSHVAHATPPIPILDQILASATHFPQ